VDEYFKTKKLSKTGDWGLYLKTMLFIPLAVLIYLYLLLGHYLPIAGMGLCVLLGLTLSLIAVNVMHDACHGSFSKRKWINNMMGLTMNALGSNAFLWKLKHNILHHTYTNIDGIDNDIATWPTLRQSPAQEWKKVHRFQYLYMFPLYGLSTIEWMLLGDFARYFSGKISSTPITNMSLMEHVVFWFSKGLYIIFYILIPAWFLGWQASLIGFLVGHVTMGLSLTILFQLAHLVQQTHFEPSGNDPRVINREWAIHEVMTTSNFAPGNKIISWLAGGLNFQIEHHLFPHISHVHYPAMSKIVIKTCHEFEVPYHSYKTVSEAFASHCRFMKELGRGKKLKTTQG
jgi:linoleoyl-CoA desaturase